MTGHPWKTSGVRDPIRAGVLLHDDGKTKAAIATFDLTTAGDSLVKSIREAIHLKTGTPRENILVAASHSHSNPDFDKHPDSTVEVVDRVGGAAAEAALEMRPVTVCYGVEIIGLSINRRKVYDGKSARLLSLSRSSGHR